MTIEQNLSPRSEGESLADFRKRISSAANSKRREPISRTPDSRPVDVWYDSVGEDGLYKGYVGWQCMKAAELADREGIYVDFALSQMNEADGADDFISALHRTIGEKITMEEIMAKIDRGFTKIEHEHGKLHFRGQFKEWCIDQLQEARNLTKKANELRQAI